MRFRHSRYVLAAAWLTALGFAEVVVADYPIAGVVPFARPAQAPVLSAVKKDSAWYAQALTGLQPPYPANFRFLEDQGNWHTPFNRPGMPGRYDIRGWHQ